MKTRVLILAVCISLIAVAALAHNGEEHVIGTVANLAQNSITVKTTANKVVTVAVVPETKFIRDKVGAKIGDLKAGERVVIHAKEPTEGSLVADTVEFASAKPAQTGVAQASNQQSKTQTLTGIVSDSACGATHSMKNMSAADCTRMCAKAGRKYALIVGARVYTLQGHEADLQNLAGEAVTVEGRPNGNNVTVDSVALVKKG
jgi:hypothetical protein